jgi:hypothetical protein
MSSLPDVDLFGRIDADLRKIMAEHQPEPLPESIHSKIRSIQRGFEEQYEG